MLLNDRQIRQLQNHRPPLIEGAPDFDHQLQAHGFDLTVRRIYSFKSRGCIDFDNRHRRLPEYERIQFDQPIVLPPGSYKVDTNEILHIPPNIMAIAQPRSSLLRSGVETSHAVWEAGFWGRSEFILNVHNPHGFEIWPNARIAQLIFIRIEPPQKIYNGAYKGLL